MAFDKYNLVLILSFFLLLFLVLFFIFSPIKWTQATKPQAKAMKINSLEFPLALTISAAPLACYIHYLGIYIALRPLVLLILVGGLVGWWVGRAGRVHTSNTVAADQGTIRWLAGCRIIGVPPLSVLDHRLGN